MNLYPIKFKEIFKQYIWGGEGFDRLSKSAPENFAAECWEIACRKDGMSVVENGYLKGKTLKELIKEYKQNLVGTNSYKKDMDFPLLIKFINAKQKLSVQVHPNDEYALIHEGESGKNEAWIILESKGNKEIVLGVNNGINKNDLIKCIKDNNVEKCLKKVHVQTGDIINIPAGLLHSINDGILLLEVQQNSNSTYRVYDYNRIDKDGKKRPLHIDRALQVINFDLAATIVHKEENSEYNKWSIAVSSNYFAIESCNLKEKILQNTNGDTFYIFIFTQGNGRILYRDEKFLAVKGDTYLIPANLGMFEIEGKAELIKTYIP